jgi:hypothetical protein
MGGHQRADPVSEDWLTPPEIVRALGPFDLDPCAACTQRHIGEKGFACATARYCKCENGLEKPWEGFVWMNPPYGSMIGSWIAKLAKHGNGIALVFARTETGWFQDCVFRTAKALLFIAGRIRFCRPDGTLGRYTGGAPSVFAAYGDLAVDRLRGLKMRGAFVTLG